MSYDKRDPVKAVESAKESPKETPAEVKQLSEHERMAKAIADAVTKGMSDGLAMSGQVNNQVAQNQREAVAVSRLQCNDCRQMRVACKGKHAQMLVLPSSDMFISYFTGIVVNGVRYLSNHRNHMVTVPAENDIGYHIAMWEKNEQELSQGRKASHNSGVLGRGGAVIPATGGFR